MKDIQTQGYDFKVGHEQTTSNNIKTEQKIEQK